MEVGPQLTDVQWIQAAELVVDFQEVFWEVSGEAQEVVY